MSLFMFTPGFCFALLCEVWAGCLWHPPICQEPTGVKEGDQRFIVNKIDVLKHISTRRSSRRDGSDSYLGYLGSLEVYDLPKLLGMED